MTVRNATKTQIIHTKTESIANNFSNKNTLVNNILIRHLLLLTQIRPITQGIQFKSQFHQSATHSSVIAH